MTTTQVMAELAAKGSDSIKKVLVRHGAKEPFFGVRIGDMKPIARKLKGRQDLAMALFATGNGDAQYLAGMIADGKLMSREELQSWGNNAAWQMISGTTVPWVASEHGEGFDLAVGWTEAPDEKLAVAGWGTLGALVTVRPDESLPAKELRKLLDRIAKEIHRAPDRVRYQMNSFVIACGTYCAPLADHAVAVARKIGKVTVDMGETECHVPDAESYIMKARRGAPVAPKRKTVRC
ncbi:MAG TPA: DNA alkylation repair protein [Opitutaceae bacterium]|nr:DNA alkylation repair protein [Opitutaceae bacterium]